VSQARYDELIQIPRAVRFPVELLVPAQFDEERPETWPRVVGRLEWLDGRLLYMPPCGDLQQASVTDVVVTLGSWVRAHPGFFLGTNEAGMRLGGATRAADAAIWRRSDVELGGGYRASRRYWLSRSAAPMTPRRCCSRSRAGICRSASPWSGSRCPKVAR
jgi:hypothetical protein